MATRNFQCTVCKNMFSVELKSVTGWRKYCGSYKDKTGCAYTINMRKIATYHSKWFKSTNTPYARGRRRKGLKYKPRKVRKTTC